MEGLRPSIDRIVATQDLYTVRQIAEAARGMEYIDERNPREPKSKKAKTEGTSRGQQGHGQGSQSEQRRRHSSEGQRPSQSGLSHSVA